MKDNKERIIDAVEATKAAFSDGIVYGGGKLLIEISDYLPSLMPPDLSDAEQIGFNIVKKSLSAPFLKLMSHADIDTKNIVLETGFGIDIETGKEVDLIEAGIIDPLTVVLNTVQSAVSVASMLITTDAIIVDKEDPNARQAGLSI
jgi:chaperonin GroEL